MEQRITRTIPLEQKPMVEFLRIVLCWLELIVIGDFLLGNRRLENSLGDEAFRRHRCQCNLHLYGSKAHGFRDGVRQHIRWSGILSGRIRSPTDCLWRSFDRMGTALPDVPQENFLEGLVPYSPTGEECL